MAIATVATEYVFSGFLLNDPADSKYKGVRLELATDKIVKLLAVGLPLFLISLAFAQEMSVGPQITCFAPGDFSMNQASYVDSFCWAAIQQQSQVAPLWLHKLFPYILLFLAILVYIPSLLWSFTAAPHLSSDLNFIMQELDRFYNRAIKLANDLVSSDGKVSPGPGASFSGLTQGCLKYPFVEHYLKTKRSSRSLVAKYLACQALTFLLLLLGCLFLGYYIKLASNRDEFVCDLQTGILTNDSTVPPAVQCKLVAASLFGLLSKINLVVYALLSPVVLYATLGPARQSSRFLQPYDILPGFGSLGVITPFYNDLSIYLLFLKENLSHLESFKCLQVLELLQETDDDEFDAVCLFRTLSQVKTDVSGSRKSTRLTLPLKKDKIAEKKNEE